MTSTAPSCPTGPARWSATAGDQNAAGTAETNALGWEAATTAALQLAEATGGVQTITLGVDGEAPASVVPARTELGAIDLPATRGMLNAFLGDLTGHDQPI